MMGRVSPGRPLRSIALAGALLACVAASAPAAATLRTAQRCYAQSTPVRMTASGLVPQAPLTVALDGQPLKYRDGTLPTASDAGSFESSFAAPTLATGVPQLRHSLSVDDGTQRARTRFTVTRPPGASFAPAVGNPKTLRARFSVWGFALDSGRDGPLWMHWVSPTGAVRSNAALGITRGDCGMLTTAPRRVFPFDPDTGRWTLAIDTHRRFSVQPNGPRAKISVTVRPIPK
jgi:hypothetical protein